MPLIPVLRRQRQSDLWVRCQPGLQRKFQDDQDYTEKPCLKKTKQNKKTSKTTTTKKVLSTGTATHWKQLLFINSRVLNNQLVQAPSKKSNEREMGNVWGTNYRCTNQENFTDIMMGREHERNTDKEAQLAYTFGRVGWQWFQGLWKWFLPCPE